ncbi:MAG: hypothetical protein AW10_01488 [Candidatus Accumulibacter appositus]|uniref:DUF3301 domain-containing protein n=1 Tax=Candidatus Accumulibacter appositus TaxID=1454003 RepID=A0A011PVL0_9PROT|nr:DUF3301 domain-containing protein [Accumulibacter sp.]EXI80875.1 MAG: hypothetical protein AW10_01488 [Candidatus Accumulibacter appositus]HRF03868.1 DUF3301 domain-containing protein [Accumulibacter sp.]
MPWAEVLSLLAMVAGGALWFDSFQSREAGMRAVRAACLAEDLLLLDDTVALASLRPGRDDEGRLRLRRVYRFEFSDTGNNRRDGHLTLLGSELVTLHLPHSERSPLCSLGTTDEGQDGPFPRLPS